MEVQNGSLKDDGSSRRDAEAQIAVDETHDQEGGGDIVVLLCSDKDTHIFDPHITHNKSGVVLKFLHPHISVQIATKDDDWNP
jgi:hypothetical protein